jgi:hypothetical protein
LHKRNFILSEKGPQATSMRFERERSIIIIRELDGIISSLSELACEEHG